MFFEPETQNTNEINLVAPTGFEPVFESWKEPGSNLVPTYTNLGERIRMQLSPFSSI